MALRLLSVVVTMNSNPCMDINGTVGARASEDERWMRVALDAARRGSPSPNPHVGAVLVHEGRLVAEGHHERAGEGHAEIVAIANAHAVPRGATLYVTLEPCNHHGRTPPCTEAILRAGIARVVIGTRDPNRNVVGGGVERLREAGVDVRAGVLESEARAIVAGWAKAQRAGLAQVAPIKPVANLEILARADLPTRFGQFVAYSFRRVGGRAIDDIAIVKGELAGSAPITTRIHSECLTGDALASTRCDCRDQLEMALQRMNASERGLLLYLRQDGRGIGIGNKIGAYELQDGGLDTVQANLRLGYEDDMRTYDVAAGMLRAMSIRRVDLCTNNPRKIHGLEGYGIEVTKRLPIIAKPRPENHRYLSTKRQKSGHLL